MLAQILNTSLIQRGDILEDEEKIKIGDGLHRRSNDSVWVDLNDGWAQAQLTARDLTSSDPRLSSKSVRVNCTAVSDTTSNVTEAPLELSNYQRFLI